MRVGAKSATAWVFPLVMLAMCVAALVTGIGNFAAALRNLEFDTYQHIEPRPYQDSAVRSGSSVRVLQIDSESVKRFGPWPWSRAVLAKLIGEIKAAGADLILLAIPLDAPDIAAPERIAILLPQDSAGAAVRAALAGLPSPDDALAISLRRLTSVTGFTLGQEGDRLPAIKSDVEFEGSTGGFRSLATFSNAVAALPNIEAASRGVGALNLTTDSDGVVRSIPMVAMLGHRPVPSLEAEALRLLGAGTNIVIRSEDQGMPGAGSAPVVSSAAIGSFDMPLRPDGSLQIYFAGPREERNISAASLDQGTVDPSALRKAVVVIAPPSLVNTPAGLLSVGEVRAEALENAILGEALRPAPSGPASLVFLLVSGFAIIVLLVRSHTLWAGILAMTVVAAAQGLSWQLFLRQHILLDAAAPGAAVLLVYLTGVGVRILEVGRARADVKGSFSDLLPVKTINEIAHAPGLLNLGGETRLVTCLSCGIRRYSALAASFADDPAGFTRLINTVMEPLIEDAVSHGAMIGPFDGEFFTSYWNAPLDDAEHAMHACEAATRMTMSLAEVNEQLSRERRFDGTSYASLEVGVGIATGPAIAGGIAVRGRTTYSVTGECTVLAGRIRALSGQYGPAVVVTESTREAASRGYAFLEVDFLALSPDGPPIKLYAMLGNPLVRASPKFRALATFHEHIFQSLRTQQWHKTRELIEQCRKLSGASQKMYDLQLARVAWFEAHPPGPDWDGAFRPVVS